MHRSLEQVVDNRYRIVKPLGAGGMAEVYLAHDNVLQRDVALKVMSGRYAGDEEFVERFKREAQSAAVLSHPNIVSIYDRGESENGTYYIAMEYLCGGTLKDRILKRGALPPHTAAAVALQIAEALQAAHEAGVVHRDIKPHWAPPTTSHPSRRWASPLGLKVTCTRWAWSSTRCSPARSPTTPRPP